MAGEESELEEERTNFSSPCRWAKRTEGSTEEKKGFRDSKAKKKDDDVKSGQ